MEFYFVWKLSIFLSFVMVLLRFSGGEHFADASEVCGEHVMNV